MKENYFIIHGSFGSPFGNWIPWLREELEKCGKEVYTPDFPTGALFQNYDNWKKLLEAYAEAGLITEDTMFFAHSIAPVFLCKFLSEHCIKVKKLVLVCGFNNYYGIDEEYDAVNRSMFMDNLVKAKACANEIVCFYSDNDPYVKYEVEKAFADAVATEQIVIPGGGHLNAESGYCEFPELLNYI